MANLSPIPVFRAFDAQGAPLAGGLLYTYEAGTSTEKATFTDSTGTVANTNPVVLDARGEAHVWLDNAAPYKLVLKTAQDVTLWTVDQVVGIGTGAGGSTPITASEWLAQADSPTFISPTSFSVPGDRRETYHQWRRLRTQNAGGTVYSTITDSQFATGTTTVTVQNDTIPLDAGLNSPAVGINSADNKSIHINAIQGFTQFQEAPGSIKMWGGATEPAGWVRCDGQELSQTTEADLFAAIGGTWNNFRGAADPAAGNFRVPDFRGAVVGHLGDGPGTSPRSLAEAVGFEQINLTEGQLPPHNHAMFSNRNAQAGSTRVDPDQPANVADTDAGQSSYDVQGDPGNPITAGVTATVGNNDPVLVMQPTAFCLFIIKT